MSSYSVPERKHKTKQKYFPKGAADSTTQSKNMLTWNKTSGALKSVEPGNLLVENLAGLRSKS